MKNEKKKFKILPVLGTLSFILAMYLTVTHFSILVVSGESMAPTFEDKSKVVVYRNGDIQIDDLVAFTPNESWGPYTINFVKRVIAGPGDRLKITATEVIVNDIVIAPILFKIENEYDMVLQENQYFVMGDNVGNSNDSFNQLKLGNGDFLITRGQIKTYGRILWVIK